MTFDAFGRHLGSALRLPPDIRVAWDVDLFDEWALDSLQAFEMIIVIETMAECLVPPPAIPEIFSLADAFAYYRELAEPDAAERRR